MKRIALFGPSGNSESFYSSGKKHTFEAMRWIFERGLDAYEYPAGNGITASIETFKKIGTEAKKYGIAMSFHAPYFISLSGIDVEKRLKSIEYIQKSVDSAEAIGADIIVIHTGSAARIPRSQALALAKDTVHRALSVVADIPVRIGLETMGKVNQLGTLDEVLEICRLDKRLCPVIDFGHLNARECRNVFLTQDDYLRVFDKISCVLGAEYLDSLHCHFSRIEWSGSGEKRHLTFEDKNYGPDFEPLIEVIAREGLSPRIICESAGTMAEDALTMKKYYSSVCDLL